MRSNSHLNSVVDFMKFLIKMTPSQYRMEVESLHA